MEVHEDTWKVIETNVFYSCIQIYGLDFSFVSYVLPWYSRAQIVQKFQYEMMDHPVAMGDAVHGLKKPSVDELERLLEALPNYDQKVNHTIIKDRNQCH